MSHQNLLANFSTCRVRWSRSFAVRSNTLNIFLNKYLFNKYSLATPKSFFGFFRGYVLGELSVTPCVGTRRRANVKDRGTWLECPKVSFCSNRDFESKKWFGCGQAIHIRVDTFFQMNESKNYIKTEKNSKNPRNSAFIWLLSRAILMNPDYYRKDPLIRKWTYGHSRCYLWNNEIGNFWFWYLWFQTTRMAWPWFVQFQWNQFEWWDQMLSACSDGILRFEIANLYSQFEIQNLNLR